MHQHYEAMVHQGAETSATSALPTAPPASNTPVASPSPSGQSSGALQQPPEAPILVELPQKRTADVLYVSSRHKYQINDHGEMTLEHPDDIGDMDLPFTTTYLFYDCYLNSDCTAGSK